MSNDPVVLTVTSNQFAADAIANMLQLEGIRTYVRAADALNHMNGGLSQRKDVLVFPDDLESARALLETSDLAD